MVQHFHNGSCLRGAYGDFWIETPLHHCGKEGLKYIRDTIKDGLIATESLTMDRNQLDTLANVTETSLFSIVYYSMVMINMDNPARDEYTYILPLIGPNGYSSATFEQSIAKPAFIVSANCKEPEAAFRLGDLMTTEYFSVMQRYGEDGINWDYVQNSKVDMSNHVPYVDGFDLYFITYDDDGFWGGTGVTNSCWRQMEPYVRQYASTVCNSCDYAQTIIPNNTPAGCADDILTEPLTQSNGFMRPPTGEGFGVAIDRNKLKKYTINTMTVGVVE